MALYETVFIARQDLSADDVDALTSKLCKIIDDAGGRIASTEYWGLRNLTYKIKKNSRGHYVLINIDSAYPAVAELKRVVSFNEDIIRSATYAVEKHGEKSLLCLAETAKSYKPSTKAPVKKEPSSLDLILDQIQFDI